MVDGGRFGLAELDLKKAFGESGCPICRLKRDSARRYIDHLLWENVNDTTTRILLARSLGFCPEHTWYMYHAERDAYGDWLGLAIIYKDLTQLVNSHLAGFEARLPVNAAPPTRWWERGWKRLTRALGRPSAPATAPGLESLSPQATCRACFYAENSERNNVGWLVEGFADEALRRSYAASEGLCLTHLRQALQYAVCVRHEVARFLAEDALTRLSALTNDLGEYARKRAWQYRHETVSAGEQDSPRRASQFFGGHDRWA